MSGDDTIRALHETTRNLAAAIEASPNPIVVVDEDCGVTLWNPAAEALYGWSAEAVLGEPPPFVREGRETEFRELFERVLAGASVGGVEAQHRTVDGEHVDVSISAAPVRDPDGDVEGAMAVVEDVTARKEREAELRHKSSLLDTLFESVPAHLYVKDRDARTVRVSEHYADPEEHVGRTALELFDDPLGREAYEDDLRVIETGDPIINKEERQPSGHWTLTSKVPWREEGEVRGLIGITRRITERKEYERALEHQNERLEEVLDVISHDLRNPLSVAIGRLELAAEGDGESLPAAKRALDRMDELIDDALALARSGQRVESIEAVDLRGTAEASWSTVLTDGAELRVEGDVRLAADPGRLRNLLENLLGNAVEHSSTGSDAPRHDAVEHSSTGNQTSSDDAPTTVRVGALADGFYVADDGPGIAEDRRDRVFDPGYSTAGDGTGFGLAIVRRIVDAHGWAIGITDSASGGARFEITGVDTADAD